MKTAILALAALVSTVQTVGWVECCCVLICKHHNDPCKHECKDKEQQAAASSCCEKAETPAPRHDHDKRCSHVEPSSEILSQNADLHPVAPLEAILVPVVDLLPVPAGTAWTAPRSDATRGSPPLLHLLFGSLLI